MRQTKIVLPDASPLFSFASIDALDLLLKLDMPIKLTDYVAWEATRSGSDTAQRIARWIENNPEMIEVVPTETGADRIRKEKAGIADRRKDVGEDTVFEAIKNEYVGPGPYVFLFEDEKMLRQVGVTFFDKYPVHMMTTFAWLIALERRNVIPDADAVFADIRGLSAPLVPRDAPPRPGVRMTLIDRAHRDEQGEDTTWKPRR